MDELIERIFSVYRKEFSTPQIEVTVVFSDDVYDTLYGLSSNTNRKIIEQSKEWIRSLNGTIVTPDRIEEAFSIIINKNYVQEENCNWVGTLCHELTHIYDYMDITKYLNCNDFNEYSNKKNADMFQIWTEFHARARGHHCLRCFASGGDMQNSFIENYNFNTEMPFQVKHFSNEYSNNQGDGYKQMYAVAQFLGRLYVWEKLFPNNYTPQTIHHIIGENRWIEELYNFFKEKDEFDKVKDSFGEMKEILCLNYKFT